MRHTQNNGAAPAPQTFEAALLEQLPALKQYLLSLTRSSADADDLMQIVAEKALRAKKSFTLGTNMQAWLRMIARNQFLSALRAKKGKNFVPFDLEVVENTLASDFAVSEAEARDDLQWFFGCLLSLPSAHADALIAVGYLGMEYEKASRLLKVAIGTLKSRMHRARLRLRVLIESNVEPQIDTTVLQWTKDVSEDDPLYPIAKAYQELSAAFEVPNPSKAAHKHDVVEEVSAKLVNGGALDGCDDPRGRDT